ncbi:Vacuolar protein sorting-associated protein 13C [Geodia barretti]|uniref:Vacuolar protein sorting-associated protein 13C n=1 Tax=Geodia barretti TaxID=519541 RepID=A0AA35WA94_GEOBA|nr:Vacuolar protein sorting-associated protein 13C [Geodia barretti]
MYMSPIWQGVIQMYSVVLGLEVLGNPVGFVRGLKKGTVGLFYHPLQGAVLGPEEFMEGVVLGSREFVGGTVGGISGVLGKVTGVLGDTAANLTMDEEFQSQRKRERTRGNVGQSLEGAARGVFAGVTGVISQPIKGAKKEGLLGLVKGAGKGVLGLVLRPTGGLIDLTSATFNAVQRKTKVGNYDITQLRPPRFIGQPKFVSPYSPHKAEGYALFLALENGRLSGDGDIYFDFVELEENPLRNLLVTNKRRRW